MNSSLTPGTALVAAAADADPVTRLVLGWLAAKRSPNTRVAYARDLGIVPRRRAGHVPSWLAWCQAEVPTIVVERDPNEIRVFKSLCGTFEGCVVECPFR